MTQRMLSAAALYNRFPLVDFDTGTHIGSAASGQIFWMRSPVYSYFVLAFDGTAKGVLQQMRVQLVLNQIILRALLPFSFPQMTVHRQLQQDKYNKDAHSKLFPSGRLDHPGKKEYQCQNSQEPTESPAHDHLM